MKVMIKMIKIKKCRDPRLFYRFVIGKMENAKISKVTRKVYKKEN